MKGYKGDYGLERYHAFETFNLGSQVAVEELVRFAKEQRIDALLGVAGRHAERQRHQKLYGAERTARGRRTARPTSS